MRPDDEVELLLSVTWQYKARKAQERVDWEACYTTYSDISVASLEQYPAKEGGGKDVSWKKLPVCLFSETSQGHIKRDQGPQLDTVTVYVL